MLVLSRKTGEKIVIGENVTITIVRIGPNTVRMGIDAPRDMNIRRDELPAIGEQGVTVEMNFVEANPNKDLPS